MEEDLKAVPFDFVAYETPYDELRVFWVWVDVRLFWKGEALLLLFLVRYLMVSSDLLWNL